MYATVLNVAGEAIGALVETHEGRPTKVEGNPQHPASKGKTDSFMQAAVLGLFPESRPHLGPPFKKDARSKWSEWDAFAGPHFAAFATKKGAGLAFLSEPIRLAFAPPVFAPKRKRRCQKPSGSLGAPSITTTRSSAPN